MTSKERCLAAIRGLPVDKTPVFPLLMFFAADRAGLTYRQFATHGQDLAEAQLRMRARFHVDALTVCSDAFRLSADLGGEMEFPEAGTPHLVRPLIRDQTDLAELGQPDPTRTGSRMNDRVEAVSTLARAVGDECLVLGWVEMPFAEACDLCGIENFMMLITDEPVLAHQVLEYATECEIAFALAQLRAGAAMIGAGDAAASLISPEMYREFALPYQQRVCRAIKDAGGLTKLHICGNTTALLPDMAQAGADLYNVDHLVTFEEAVRVYGQANLCFKGNLDPVNHFLGATPQDMRVRCRNLIQRAKGARFMLSAGCEIPAAVKDEVFASFCGSAENCHD